MWVHGQKISKNALRHSWRNSIKTQKKVRGLQFLDMFSLFERLIDFYQPIIIAQVSFSEI